MAVPSQQLAELWRSLAPSLLLLARTRCDMADDCVQEAFVRLSRQSELPNEPIAWLVRVVRNAAIDMARSEKRRKHREVTKGTVDYGWFVEQGGFERQWIEKDVQEALMQLVPNHREIVVAHIWNGLTFRQIASIIGTSPSSAHRAYLEAIEQLKRSLANYSPQSHEPTV